MTNPPEKLEQDWARLGQEWQQTTVTRPVGQLGVNYDEEGPSPWRSPGAKPSRQLPKAMFPALGIATVIYVAIALGVFGTLTVDKVISSGGTAIAVAAEPTLGRAGYWLMTVTALFATAGATNAGLYPTQGLSERLAETGQFPPLMARKLGGRASNGLLVQAAVCLVLALVFNLDAIASIGSAAALVILRMETLPRREDKECPARALGQPRRRGRAAIFPLVIPGG